MDIAPAVRPEAVCRFVKAAGVGILVFAGPDIAVIASEMDDAIG